MEQQQFRLHIRIELNVGADIRLPKTALRQRYSQSTITYIVGRFHRAFPDQFSDRFLHSLLIFHIELRRLTP